VLALVMANRERHRPWRLRCCQGGCCQVGQSAMTGSDTSPKIGCGRAGARRSNHHCGRQSFAARCCCSGSAGPAALRNGDLFQRRGSERAVV